MHGSITNVVTLGSTVTREANEADSDRLAVLAPVMHLYVVLDCEHLHDAASRFALDGVATVHIGRGERTEATRSESGADLFVKIRDPMASRQHARIHARDGAWIVEDLGGKNGTWVNGRRVDGSTHASAGAIIETGQTFLTLRPSAALHQLADVIGVRADAKERGLVTVLPELVDAFDRLAAFARTDGQVAILGETGSGKDFVAQSYHTLTRRPGPLIAVNCAALTDGLVEATLFGHKKGAYSGATSDNLGNVRTAEGGTLFLDEIGDLRLSAQAALLRVIDAREVTPVGASRAVPVDIRIVSATHRDIPQMVERGEFRQDLWARLAGFVLRLPPLRARLEDMSIFLSVAVRQHEPDRADSIRLSIPAARAILLRRWPANIRELSSAIREALSYAKTDTLAVEDLPKGQGPEFLPHPRQPAFASAPSGARGLSTPEEEDHQGLDARDRMLRARIVRLLEEHGGNVSEVARSEGKHRGVIHEWIKKLGIDPARYRSKIRRP
jgi:transcriptional regulator with GAF, ATPase, and Fis domain